VSCLVTVVREAFCVVMSWYRTGYRTKIASRDTGNKALNNTEIVCARAIRDDYATVDRNVLVKQRRILVDMDLIT
jgi:hypothetical protein